MEKIHYAVNSYSLLILLAVLVPFIIAGCFGGQKIAGESNDGNVAVVKKYFKAIDNRDAGAMPGLFAVDAKQGFVGNAPIIGIKAIEIKLELILSQIESMKTEFINFTSEGDTVVAHVKHDAVFKAGGAFKNRAGIHPPLIVLTESTNVSWQAIASFRLKDGLIVEEQIVRDELAILQQLGTITVK